MIEKTCLVCSATTMTIFQRGLLDGREKNQDPPPGGKEVWRCQNCGSFTYFPPDGVEEMQAYHDYEYFVCPDPTRQRGYTDYLDPDHLQSKIEWGRLMIGWLYQYDKNKQEAEKWALDVGCACGATTYGMSQFHLLKVNVVGLEVCPDILRWGEQKELPLVRGRLPKISWAPASYDYVVFWDSLNHDPFPRQVAQETARILKPGGLVLIHTPDATQAILDWQYWSPHQNSCAFTLDGLYRMWKDVGIDIFRRRDSMQPGEMILFGRKIA